MLKYLCNTKNAMVWLFLFFVFPCHGQAAKKQLVLENNGYNNLLVAIGKDVPEDGALEARIKGILTEASKRLFNATKHRAYFKTVQILIPATWTHQESYGTPVLGQSYAEAHIRVDKQNPKWYDMPYTHQPGKCGEPGKYMHLTTGFLLNPGLNLKPSYGETGPPEKYVVHEWGHLRWGLFDEYSNDEDGNQHFYQQDEVIYPVGCSKAMRKNGRMLNWKTRKTCKIFDGQRVEKDCRFMPRMSERNTARASYMYRHAVPTVEEFCDDEGPGVDEAIAHNDFDDSRSDQNRECNSRSAWAVMREHEDFRNGNNPSVDPKTVNPVPSFEFIQYHRLCKYVLLLDTSGSMSNPEYRPLTMVRQASSRFINYIVPDGTFLSIVTFSSASAVVQPLTEVTGANVRKTFVNSLPTVAKGGTAMGKGLLKAISVLTRDGNDNAGAGGAKIILISDGQETDNPRSHTLIPQLVKLGIEVHTIAYSKAADAGLTKLASDTGGKSDFQSGDGQSDSMTMTLTQIGECQSSKEPQGPPLAVASNAINLPAGVQKTGKFYIDDTTGKDTKLTFSYIMMDPGLEVVVTGPPGSGVTIDKNEPFYNDRKDLKMIEIEIPGLAKAGEWTYTLKGEEETTVMVNVISSANGDVTQDPIRVTSYFGNNKLASAVDAKLNLYAEVVRGFQPVVGAKVRAIIEGGAKPIPVYLLDDGIEPDRAKGDGVYSAMLTRNIINGPGRFSTRIEVEGVPDQPTSLRRRKRDTTRNARSAKFQRVISAGELIVAVPDEPVPRDVFPPPRIKDFSAVIHSMENATVNLTWSAVGDGVSRGNATTYEMRIGSFECLRKTFEKCEQHMMNVIPLERGEKEQHIFDLSEFNRSTTLYLALRTIDEAGNKAEPSNIVSVVFKLPKTFSSGEPVEIVWIASPPPPTTVPPDGSSTALAPPGGSSTSLVIGIVVPLILIILVIVIVLAIWLRSRNKGKIATRPKGVDEEASL